MSEEHNNQLDLRGDITTEEALAGLADQNSEHAELLRLLIEKERVEAKLKELLGRMTNGFQFTLPDEDGHKGSVP